ncbi:MAG: BMC domain-containing protein [Firmicutes bacterium]|nr:BMC domain-containing protein [Bacillota bacterium]
MADESYRVTVEDGYRALGMLELASIAHGYEAADQLVKTASVEYVTAKPTCPGKFIVIIRGSISAVTAALDRAKQTAGESLVDTFMLGNPADAVFDALTQEFPYKRVNAMGIVETWTAASAIVAADQGVKAAETELVRLGLASHLGGKGYVIYVGEVAAVQAAVEAAAADPRVAAKLITTTVIPSPSPQLWDLMKDR